MTGSERLLTRCEAAKLAGISTRTIRRHEREGNVTFQKGVGGVARVPESEFRSAPILRLGKGLRPHGVGYETARLARLKTLRYPGAQPPANPLKVRHLVSMNEAEAIANAIKARKANSLVVDAMNRGLVTTAAMTARDPAELAQRTAPGILDLHMVTMRRSSPVPAILRRLGRKAREEARRRRELELSIIKRLLLIFLGTRDRGFALLEEDLKAYLSGGEQTTDLGPVNTTTAPSGQTQKGGS